MSDSESWLRVIRSNAMSFIRYVMTQLVSYGVDLGLFALLVFGAGWGSIPSNVVSKLTGGIVAFLAHRRYTFRLNSSDHDHRQMVRYAILFAANIPLSSAVLWLLLKAIPHPVAAKIISDVSIVLLNFWLSRKWVFSVNSERH